jgi:hypothetical protein
MYKADWRSPAAYLPLQQYGRAGFAWEIVRRDLDYTRAYERLDRHEPPETDASEPLARRWGLRAFADPNVDCDRQPIFWLPEVLPTVLYLQPARPDLTSNPLDVGAALTAPSAQALRSGPTTDVLIAQLTAAHRLWLDQDPAGAMAVVIPLDRLFDYRAAAALNFERAPLAGRPDAPVALRTRPAHPRHPPSRRPARRRQRTRGGGGRPERQGRQPTRLDRQRAPRPAKAAPGQGA